MCGQSIQEKLWPIQHLVFNSFFTHLKKIGWLFIAGLSFFVLQSFYETPAAQNFKEGIQFPQALLNLTAGHQAQAADLFWLSFIADIDYCELKIDKTRCQKNSWLFQTVDFATQLDPKLEASMYQTAGLSLTVLISDYPGASVLFDRGVKQHPKSWSLLYAAGYHALIEEKNKKKASELYFAAAQNGAPEWVNSMAGRLAVEGGDKIYAEKILQTMIETSVDEKLIARLKEKLSEKLSENLADKQSK